MRDTGVETNSIDDDDGGGGDILQCADDTWGIVAQQTVCLI